MKKIIAMLLAVMTIVSLFAGCGAAKKSMLVNEGKLTVAISPDFAPMEFVIYNENGEAVISGFDVMLSNYMAEELGLELQLMPMDFFACQAAVAAGTVDMSISGYSYSEDRAANYNLSDIYYAGDNETEQILITTAENAGKFTDAASLAGLKVGAQAASLQESLCKEQLPDCELVVYTDVNTGALQLKKGDFDVMAVAAGNGEALIASNPELALSGFEFVVTSEQENNLILLKKGNDELTAKVNEVLAKALAANLYDGWYAEAKELAGIGVNVSYDEAGNPITE